MNSFGRIFRVNIFGESHGESVGVNIDGVPAGLPLSVEDFLEDIERRKGGTQKGTTPRQESDMPIFKSGLFNNVTTGAPITILFENANTRSSDYQKQRAVPRPGHADFVANKKFGGFEDYRGGGHFSGRLTVCLVAAGVIAKRLLQTFDKEGIEVKASITEMHMLCLLFLQCVVLNLEPGLLPQECLAASTMMRSKMSRVKPEPIMQVVLLVALPMEMNWYFVLE